MNTPLFLLRILLAPRNASSNQQATMFWCRSHLQALALQTAYCLHQIEVLGECRAFLDHLAEHGVLSDDQHHILRQFSDDSLLAQIQPILRQAHADQIVNFLSLCVAGDDTTEFFCSIEPWSLTDAITQTATEQTQYPALPNF